MPSTMACRTRPGAHAYPSAMHARTRTALALAALVVLAACGGSGKKKAAPPPPPPTTTTTVPQPTVTVTPPTGQSGTKLTLAVSNFATGDTVTFVIDMPGGRKFTGQPHTVAADGTVSTTFLLTSQNPPGDYVVHASATKGQTADGHFTVTAAGAAGATPTTAAGGAGTPTTARPATTTTVKR